MLGKDAHLTITIVAVVLGLIAFTPSKPVHDLPTVNDIGITVLGK